MCFKTIGCCQLLLFVMGQLMHITKTMSKGYASTRKAYFLLKWKKLITLFYIHTHIMSWWIWTWVMVYKQLLPFMDFCLKEYRPNHFGGRIRCESTIFAMYKITNIVNKEQCKKLPLNTYSTKRNPAISKTVIIWSRRKPCGVYEF